ncbi:MAG TPA: hypothetical protein RMH99_15080 [Sandaracinaceae bacterium LLY-WYZ-13_1]|nr:hypothetical protein [Sandaracinaceae bacterium LLY-WYZ-13_1]
MTKWLSFAAAALLAVSLASPASAQWRRPHPGPHATRGAHDLARSARRVARLAAHEPSARRFARVVERLADAAAHDTRDRRLARLYRRARRALVTGRGQPSDALLDAWDDVVVAARGLRDDRDRPRPRPRPGRTAWEVEGTIERTPFRFVARDLDELERSCASFVSAIDTRWVDDVTVGDRRARHRSGYWDANGICSVVILNASPRRPSPVLVQGTIEDRVPFAVRGDAATARRLLAHHLPRVTRTMRVDDLVVGDRRYRNGPSYWSPAQITAIVTSQLPGDGHRGRRYTTRGTIERVAFSFSGASAQAVQSQCRAFVSAAVTDRIDDLEVDGRRLRNRRNYWSVDEVCRLIATQARPG